MWMRRRLWGLLLMLFMPATGVAWSQLGGDAQRSAQVVVNVAEQPQLSWQQPLGAPVFASAVTAAEAIYTVAGRSVQARHAAHGRLLWQVENSSEMSATPVLVGRWLIIAGKDGVVRALDRSTGSRGWEYRTRGRVVAALLAHKDTVYVGATDHYLYALAADSGQLRWRFEAPDYKYGGLYAPATYADDTVYFGVKNAWFYAVEARTGVMRWRTRLGSAMYAAPVIADGRIYIGSYDRHLYALRQSDGAVLWRSALADWPQGAVLLHGGRVHVACRNGEVLALNRDDGAVEWRIDLGSELRHGPVVGRHGHALLGTVGGEVVTLDLAQGKVMGRVFVSGAVHAQPALSAQGVFVTTLTGELLRLQ